MTIFNRVFGRCVPEILLKIAILDRRLVGQVEELLRPGRQRLAAEGARFVHPFLAQLLHARLAVLVATRQLSHAKGGTDVWGM